MRQQIFSESQPFHLVIFSNSLSYSGLMMVGLKPDRFLRIRPTDAGGIPTCDCSPANMKQHRKETLTATFAVNPIRVLACLPPVHRWATNSRLVMQTQFFFRLLYEIGYRSTAERIVFQVVFLFVMHAMSKLTICRADYNRAFR